LIKKEKIAKNNSSGKILAIVLLIYICFLLYRYRSLVMGTLELIITIIEVLVKLL